MPKEVAGATHRLAGVTRPKRSQRLSDMAAGGQVGDYRDVRDREN